MKLVNATIMNASSGSGSRFAFGKNWQQFLATVGEPRIEQAQSSLREMLARESLAGGRFLDAGCGSGLFSLAARRLGASVYSIDFDADAVACTRELKRRYGPDDSAWEIAQGSVLDPGLMGALGQFDVVYSWGVLHHTGDLWRALDIVIRPLAPGGALFIAIYNDQGPLSTMWAAVKHTYNQLPRVLQPAMCAAVAVPLELGACAAACLAGDPARYVRSRIHYRSRRGMSWWHDMVDWVGGYPFEVAKPEAVVQFCRERGLVLDKLKTVGGRLGCNEFVFRRSDTSQSLERPG